MEVAGAMLPILGAVIDQAQTKRVRSKSDAGIARSEPAGIWLQNWQLAPRNAPGDSHKAIAKRELSPQAALAENGPVCLSRSL